LKPVPDRTISLLLEAARSSPPDVAVPLGFERRVMRVVQWVRPEDSLQVWLRGFRTAVFASVAVAMASCLLVLDGSWLSKSEVVGPESDGGADWGISSPVEEEDPLDQIESG
jgi:hypothetical protein